MYSISLNHSNETTENSMNFAGNVVYCVSFATLCGLISLITVCGNTLLFYTVLRTPQLRTPTNSLLLSLATADLVAGTIMIPLYILQFFNRMSETSRFTEVCLARKYLFLLTSGASITSLAVVSVDRMIAVTYPFIYGRKMNAKVVTSIIITVWSLCLILTSVAVFVPLKSWETILENCRPGIPRASYLIVTPVSFYLSGIAILVSHIKIFTIARRHRRKITAHQEPSVQPHLSDVSNMENNNLPRSSVRTSTFSISKKSVTRTRRFTRMRTTLASDLKAARTVGILVGLFLICWSPVAIFYIYINATDADVKSSPKYTYIHDTFMLLSFLNAAFDPLLYALLNRDIRFNMKRHLANLFKCK